MLDASNMEGCTALRSKREEALNAQNASQSYYVLSSLVSTRPALTEHLTDLLGYPLKQALLASFPFGR